MIDFPAIAHLIFQKLTRWSHSILGFLPEIAIAILVILLARFLSGIFSRAVSGGLGRVSNNASLVGLLGTVVWVVGFALSTMYMGLSGSGSTSAVLANNPLSAKL